MMERVTILGTGLIGTSVGLALRRAGFRGQITGWDKRGEEAEIALGRGALSEVTEDPDRAAYESDVVVLATPVLGVLDWMERLAPAMSTGQLVTDVGSTKRQIVEAAGRLFPRKAEGTPDREAPEGGAEFLAGHPMAGKERGGAALGSADLFDGAVWLFTPDGRWDGRSTPMSDAWKGWVREFGARTIDIDPVRHDELCALVSHVPQLVSTALAAMLEEKLRDAPEVAEIGGRALREMTRLGASPYSMWRDVALTNTEPIARGLLALELELGHLRENLRTPQLREEFERANSFGRQQM